MNDLEQDYIQSLQYYYDRPILQYMLDVLKALDKTAIPEITDEEIASYYE